MDILDKMVEWLYQKGTCTVSSLVSSWYRSVFTDISYLCYYFLHLGIGHKRKWMNSKNPYMIYRIGTCTYHVPGNVPSQCKDTQESFRLFLRIIT